MSIPIGYSDLALGTVITLPHVDGKELKIKIPVGTNSGDTVVISGRGLPSSRGIGRGDVVVLCKLHMPRKFNKATRKTLESIKDELAGGDDAIQRILDDAADRRS